MKNTNTLLPPLNLSSFSTPILALLLLFSLNGCSSSGGSGSRASLTIDSPSAVEGGNASTVQLVFTVTLSEAAEQTVTLDYTTADDVATLADSDFTAVSGSLTIPAGSQIANVSVFTNGDNVFEQDETFRLVVSNAQGIRLESASYTGRGTIINDDDADPKGYFTGAANLNNTDYADMIALAYSNRILLMSPSANMFYDIAIDTLSVNDYSGTVEVYQDGLILAGSVTLSGTTNELQIEGTFANGSGFASGSFDVTFDAANNKPATLPRIEGNNVASNLWTGDFYGIDQDTGSFSSTAGQYVGIDDTTDACVWPTAFTPGTLMIPNGSTNIYSFGHPIEDVSGGTCTPPYQSTGHTGFAAVVDDTGTDDKLVLAFANGTIALFAIMNH